MIGAAARLRRLPRPVFWVAGATLSCAGALGARFLSESFPMQDRIPIWLAGAGLVFLGLCVVSFGTRARLEPLPEESDDQKSDGGA